MIETLLGTLGADAFSTLFMYVVVGIVAVWVVIGIAVAVSFVRYVRGERRRKAEEAIYGQFPEFER